MNKKKISKPFVIIILCLAIIFSFAFCIQQYLRLERANLIATYREVIQGKISQYHNKLNGANVGLIASWMTFDYINKIFALPADYLKNTLNISDAHYPQISISRYEKNQKLDSTQFLAHIQSVVAAYFSNH